MTGETEKFDFDILDRKFLQKLRKTSEEKANTIGLGSNWRRAYERLADAADHLDALWARIQV